VTENDVPVRRASVAVVVAAVVCVGMLLIAVTPRAGASTSSKTTIVTAPFAAPNGVTLADSPPPWPLPADARPYIAAAGLEALGQEQLAVHYHAHLDVFAKGKRVEVPPGIGFVVQNGRATALSELHTHDTSGIVHVESAQDEPYTLGQVFTEWGVALDAKQVGGLEADGTNVLRAYVNGRRFQGDPATIVLKPHQEIAVWYGPAREKPKVPKSFAFPEGL
jgi:hypothetical protein